MEYLIIAAIVIVVIAVIITIFGSGGVAETKSKIKTIYRYNRKGSVMTAAEESFYQRLISVAGDRYYVFPQVHLDALLDHKVKGQDWRAALSVIHRKSVDYVLCDKQTMQSVYAVELDDSSHDTPARQARDDTVDQLLASVGLPLVRFRNVGSMTDNQIAQQFAEAASVTVSNI